jgi:hypothetical protein
MLDYVALFFIFFLLIAVAVVIVFIGSLPSKIAVKRGHPWPEAVTAASWIGLATGVFWPVAFIWAFVPLPVRAGGASAAEPEGEVAKLRERLATLEATVEELRSQAKEDGS